MPKQCSIFEKDIERDTNTEGKIKESESEEEITNKCQMGSLLC